MKATMHKKALVLILEGLLFSLTAQAEESRYCQTEEACKPCDAKDASCRSGHGARIDHGASLGARSTPANGEREIGTETFVFSDADTVTDTNTKPAPGTTVYEEPAPVLKRFIPPPPRVRALSARPAPAPEKAEATAETPESVSVITPAAPPLIEHREVVPGQRTELAPSSFISGGSEMSAVLKAHLDGLVDYLQPHGKLRIRVIGHTDTQRLSPRTKAKYRDNQGLGQARADIVAGYLAHALHLTPEQVSTGSRGPDQPLASNRTLEGMAKNRRVEIQVWYEDVVTHREPAPVPPPVAAPAPPAPVPVAAPAPVEPPPQVMLEPMPEPAPLPAAPAPKPPRTCAEILAARGNGLVRAKEAPFRISIDGVPQDEEASGVIDPDIQRCTDVALAKSDIQIRYDPLEQTPVLNAHAWPNAVPRNGVVEITGWSNYAAYIAKAEVRLFAADASTQGTPLAVLPVELGQPVAWKPAGVKGNQVQYVLRVYNARGAFDETRPKRIDLTDQVRPTEDVDTRERERLAGYGENSLAIHNITVHGSAVTANGYGIRAGEAVRFLGQPVPVDAKGDFAARQILPAGPHVVEVEVDKANGEQARYSRNLSIADDDWFYIGIADLTVGRNQTHGPAQLVTADATDHFDNKLYSDGRLAFYLRGKVKGEWLLTASADTREQPVKSLFSNFTAKDPQYLLRSLDPDKYYPVYGDDSTTVDDAPTQGKFFVRLARGDSQVMWGSFKTSFTGSEFANYSRALYGARAKLVSDSATKYGEKRGTMEVFAADPGTLEAREEFRGTGGSLYYLQNMDITPGSERVWVEIRDKDSGIVLNTRQLVAVQDYEVNALQGRVILREPLASTATAGTLVQSGDLSGNPVYLVATYEYAPGVTSVSNMVVGGRASAWVNDHLQIGTSGYRQDGPRQRLKGIDATWRYKPGTYVKVEGARSDGAGSGMQTSQDGGFGFNPVASTGGKANAKRVEAGLDFSDLGSAQGKVTFYWQDREAGFSGPGQIAYNSEATRQQGGSVAWQINPSTDLKLKLDEKVATSQSTRAAEVNVGHVLNPNWKLGVGVRGDDMNTSIANASPTLSQTGERTDAVARLDYTPDAAGAANSAGWNAYGYLQGTLAKSGTRPGNDRVGLGGEDRVNDRFKLSGEVSGGNGGLGAKIGGDWQVDDRSSVYTNYSLTPDRTDDGFRGRAGLLTTGGKTRYSDALSLNAEERYQHGDGPSGLVHAFGLDLSPDDRWTYGLKLEAGKLSDPLAGDLERQAVGLSLGYHRDATRYAGALEYRDEKGTSTRKTWLMKNTLGYQLDPDWRFLGRLNFSNSVASGGAFQDGRYVELVTGYAWRPIANDRWNTLFRYSYLYNLPTNGQLLNSLAASDYAQRSHILSVDTLHDLRPWLSLGGKLGWRRGEMKDNTIAGDWQSSDAWLAILRADWHWVHEWDLLTELRRLSVSTASDQQTGALLGVYRHLDQNFKLGVGYNFTRYSDDLTDLSYRSQGWFVNLIGKL
jgi:outer membrane protein OmpA-like peptidoglycan-associated protein